MKKRSILYLFLIIVFFASCYAASAQYNCASYSSSSITINLEMEPGDTKAFSLDDYYTYFNDSRSFSINENYDDYLITVTKNKNYSDTINISAAYNNGSTTLKVYLYSYKYIGYNSQTGASDAICDTKTLIYNITVKSKTPTATPTPLPATKSFEIQYNGNNVTGQTVSLDLNNSETIQLRGAPNPSGASKNFSWSSSDDSIASVNQSTGSVTGKKAGKTVKITATTKDGTKISNFVNIKITNPAASGITIKDSDGKTISSSTIKINFNTTNTYQLTPVTSPVNAYQKVKWTSENTQTAVVNENTGLVTFKQTGTVRITASAIDGSGVSSYVNFEIPAAKSVSILKDGKGVTSPIILNLNQSDTIQFSAAAVPSEALQQFEWESSDVSVASVNKSTGLVTAKGKAGTTVIKAVSKDGTGKYAEVTVKVPAPDKIIIKNEGAVVTDKVLTMDLNQSNTIQLQAAAVPAEALQSFTWSSTDENIASVDINTGLVTGKIAGEATITAKAKDGSGKSASVTINLKEPTTDLLLYINTSDLNDVSGKSTTIYQNENKIEYIYAYPRPYGALSQIEWISSDPAIAEIESVNSRYIISGYKLPTAKLTIKSTGTVRITALTTDGSYVSSWIDLNILKKTTSGSSENYEMDYRGYPSCGYNGCLAYYTLIIKPGFINPGSSYSSLPWYNTRSACRKVIVEDGVTEIGDYWFYNMGKVEEFVLSDSIIRIGNRAFYGTNITDPYIIPKGTKKIGNYAFFEGMATDTLIIPDGVEEIGDYAFSYNSTGFGQIIPKNVTIPSSVYKIGSSPFFLPGNITFSVAADSYADQWASSYNVNYIGEDPSKLTASLRIHNSDGTDITGTTLTLDMNDTGMLQLYPVIEPADASRNIEWSSSKPEIASIYSTSGRVFGIKAGTTLITAKATDGSGKTASVTINVQQPLTDKILIQDSDGNEVKNISLYLINRDNLKLTAVVYPSSASQEVVWKSNNVSAAAVDQDGFVTGISSGTANITVTAVDGSGKSASVTVNVIPIPTATPVPTSTPMFTDTPTKTPVKPTNTPTMTPTKPTSTPTPVRPVNTPIPVGAGRITISTVTADAGKDIELSVRTANNPGFGNLWMTLEYDESRLTYLGVEDSALQNWNDLKSPYGSSTATSKTIFWQSSMIDNLSPGIELNDNIAVTFNGEILKLKFHVKENAMAGKAVVRLTVDEAFYYDFDSDELTKISVDFEVTNGGITVTASTPTPTKTPAPTNTPAKTTNTPTPTKTPVPAKTPTPVPGGDKVTWSVSGTTLTISGSGTADYQEDKAPWFSYHDKITKVIVKDGITAIGNYWFQNFLHMTQIVIPESVTSIGEDAFFCCFDLPKITLPNNLQTIGSSAFGGCHSLTSINIPDGVKKIEFYTFGGCDLLAKVILPESLTSIDYSAFVNCKSLKSIKLPSSLTYISSYNVFPKSTKVSVYAGTYAEQWAKKNKQPYTILSGLSIWMNGREVTGQTVDLDSASTNTLQLSVQFTYANNNGVTWKSSSPKVASVSSGGKVTVYKAGTTTITAAVNGSKVKETVKFKISAMVQPGSLYISGSDSVAEKKTVKLSMGFNQNPQPANKKVTWSSSNTGIATVSSAGVVKGVKQGKTTIRVCSAENSTICASKEITVTPVTQSVVIKDLGDGSKAIDVNSLGTYRLSAEALNSKGTKEGINQAFTWKSSSPKVASVDQNGVVTAYKAGKVTITAAANDGSKKSAKVVITVKSMVQDGSLVVSGAGNVAAKKTIKMTAVFNQKMQPTNKKVTWTSGNASIAKVSSSGVVTGVSAGSTSITVCSADRPSVCAVHKINVTTAASGVIVSGPSQIGLMDKTAKLKASVYPADASQEVTWKSSSPKIAEVSRDGVVTVYQTGKVTIMATAADGSKKSGKLNITVVGGSVLNSTLLGDANTAGLQASETDLDEIPNVPVEIPTEGSVENPAAAEGNEGTEAAEMPEPIAAGEETRPETEETEEPHFAMDEAWMSVGESLVLDIVNPGEEAVMVGLGGDADAVLWNEELRMLTSIGEAEVTAFLSTIDPVEVKDMMTIHIVSEVREVEEVSEEEGEAEGLIDNSDQWSGISDQEDYSDQWSGISDQGDNSGQSEGISDQEFDSVEWQVTNDQEDEPAATEETDEPAPEEPAAEPVEILIRDLGEYDVLSGEADGVIMIDRERIELDDDILSGLVFEIEDESVAKPAEQSADEILVTGIGIRLLGEGETKLVIRQKGEEAVLRAIRLVVTAAPAAEEEAAEEEVLAESGMLLDAGNDSAEDQNLLEFGEGIVLDEIIF